ncbi:MAG: DNRLRE domain-containing protein [Rhodocyclaceae bacterium]|jgi:hypothetical protein|nr:DNRLRE domain-containing protein [Rhodocyclaceae bacterium]MCA3145843.1 DNRLRE domain-containing protein [Rhodocyclaceae bacterium]
MTPRKACFPAAVLVVLLAMVSPGSGHAVTATLPASADNTLFEDNASYSGGASPSLYVGSIASGSPRRALLRFDLSGIPPGSVVTAVTVSLTVTKAARRAAEDDPGRLHRLTAAWGEGASSTIGGAGDVATPQDATWRHRFYGNPPGVARVEWNTPGGDFVATPSAERNLGLGGPYVFTSTPPLVADVQAWVNNPAGNHGWILFGSEGTEYTARQLDSREGGTGASRPTLTVEYTLGASPVDENDIPLPGWALCLLGAGLAASLAKRGRSTS